MSNQGLLSLVHKNAHTEAEKKLNKFSHHTLKNFQRCNFKIIFAPTLQLISSHNSLLKSHIIMLHREAQYPTATQT